LVKVKLCVGLVWPTVVVGKVSVVPGKMVRTGPPEVVVPVPVSMRATEGVEVLLVTMTLPKTVPAACGLKVKASVQLALAARLGAAVQVPAEVCEKEAVRAFVKLRVRVPVPVLVKVKVCAALV
jgi:phosphoribosylcarboxyaminoimidazole (NCAIR) mutase